MGWGNGRVWVGIHLVVLTAGAYVAADLVNLLIARQLEASIRVDDRVPGAAPRAVSRVLPDPVAYARILEGNLFNPALRGPALLPVVEAPPPTAPLDVQMTLIGTGEGEDAPSFAVIEDRITREQRVYRVGDVVKDGVVLAKVERNQIVLRLGAQQQVLTLYTDGTEDVASGAGAPRAPGDVAAVTGGVRQVQANRWVLDKQEVSAALENLPQLLTKARVIPNFSDGKPDGFKIFSIAPDSLYAKIGLQNGDVLQQINGVEIKDPENFMRVFQQLKDETNIALDFVRNNRRESFAYEIR
jgi:general secretion pathway protein C